MGVCTFQLHKRYYSLLARYNFNVMYILLQWCSFAETFAKIPSEMHTKIMQIGTNYVIEKRKIV